MPGGQRPVPTKVGTYRSGAARYPVSMNDDSRFLLGLQRRQAAGEHLRYLCFWGHQPPRSGVSASCFSQWYDAGFSIDGVYYRTAEHYMMAGKARLFGDTTMLDQILASATPESAKALGRRIEGFDDAQWKAIGPSSRRMRRWVIFCAPRQTRFWWKPVRWILSGESAWPRITPMRTTRRGGAD